MHLFSQEKLNDFTLHFVDRDFFNLVVLMLGCFFNSFSGAF